MSNNQKCRKIHHELDIKVVSVRMKVSPVRDGSGLEPKWEISAKTSKTGQDFVGAT